ncbi:MAG TPA: hypothetical protein VFG79_02930 [Solirubrobacter sp.]|nr:hypothetical protein [Solirubrobacter sp.]
MLAAPASAAPVLAPLNRCYIAAAPEPTQRERVRVSATGFTPLATVDIYVDDVFQDETQAFYDGSIDGAALAPYSDEPQRPFTVRLTERDAPINTAAQASLVTRLAVEQVPSRAGTRRRVRFRGRGFTSLDTVYAHYVFAGKSRRTVRIGHAHGPCGTFSKRRRQFPFKRRPRAGSWTIWFDQERTYNPNASPRVSLEVTVKKRARIKGRRRARHR